MSKLFKVSYENYNKVKGLLEENNIPIEKSYSNIIEPYIEFEVEYQLSEYKNNNKELVEAIVFDDELKCDLKNVLMGKTELFIDEEVLQEMTNNFMNDRLNK